MTKTIVLGQKEEKTKQLKPIAVKTFLTAEYDKVTVNLTVAVDEYEFATLLCKSYSTNDFNEDLILLHNTENPSDQPGNTILCMGRWNDGIV